MNDKPIYESKRFISTVAAIVAMVIVAYVPQFQSVEGELVTGIAAVAGLLVLGYSAENVAAVVSSAKVIAAKTESKLDDQIAAGVEGALLAAGIIPAKK